MTFKCGDLVMLKSGGPTMTVERVIHDEVVCVWFINSDLMSDVFLADSLERSDKEDN